MNEPERMRALGFLRESSSSCDEQSHGSDPFGIGYSGLDEYLKVIFPDTCDWVHDKTIPDAFVDGIRVRTRPDYRSESLKLIVEFDGLLHYQNPEKIVSDMKATRNYRLLGYRVVRIPYFLQLTEHAVERLFGVHDGSGVLFREGVPSFGLSWKNTPAYLCPLGVQRMAKEFLEFGTDQLDANLKVLEESGDDNLTGLSFLRSCLESAKTEDAGF